MRKCGHPQPPPDISAQKLVHGGLVVMSFVKPPSMFKFQVYVKIDMIFPNIQGIKIRGALSWSMSEAHCHYQQSTNVRIANACDNIQQCSWYLLR